MLTLNPKPYSDEGETGFSSDSGIIVLKPINQEALNPKP